MKAARYYGLRDIRIEDIPEPDVKPHHIKVKPAFVGICGTDLHEYLGGPTFNPVTPHPITGETIPVTIGHEFSGTVSELGEGVSGFKVGQKVVVQPTIYDGTCAACKMGKENVCYSSGFVGLSGWGGGLSGAVVVPANYVLAFPEDIGLDVGALVEPLSVGWHAVGQSPLKKDSVVLILGGGPIGISVLLALKARGCGDVIVSEISSERKRFAKHFGADHVVDPSADDVIAFSKSKTGGEGVDIVFDCAGVAQGLEAACQAIKVNGTVVNVAIWEKAVPFQPNHLVLKEGNFTACLGYLQKDFKEVIQAIASGAMKPEDMITRKIKLERLVEDGYHTLINEKDKHVKILVEL